MCAAAKRSVLQSVNKKLLAVNYGARLNGTHCSVPLRRLGGGGGRVREMRARRRTWQVGAPASLIRRGPRVDASLPSSRRRERRSGTRQAGGQRKDGFSTAEITTVAQSYETRRGVSVQTLRLLICEIPIRPRRTPTAQ